MYQNPPNNHKSPDVAVALVPKKGDKVTVKNILGQIAKASKKISSPVGKITMSGLHAAIASASKHQRMKIVTGLAGLSTPVEFTDAFPFTQEDLKAYVKVKLYLEQPENEGREDIRPFTFPHDSLTAGQVSRGAVKNTQSAEFDAMLLKARLKIAELKSEKMSEEAIAATLNSTGKEYTTRKGGKFTQGQVNRINKMHESIWFRFLKMEREPESDFMENSLRPVDQLIESVEAPMATTSALRFDKDRMKSASYARQPSHRFSDYSRHIDVVIIGPSEQLAKGVYLKFVDQDEKIADSLVVPHHAIDEEGRFSIDVRKDTMLLMGGYRMELYDENGMLINRPSDAFNLTVGLQTNMAEKADMYLSSVTGKVFSSPRQ